MIPSVCLKFCSPGETLMPFRSCQPWSPRDTSGKPRRGRESAALGWSCAAELGWAPGMEGTHGKWAALPRDSSAQEQLLCKAQQG